MRTTVNIHLTADTVASVPPEDECRWIDIVGDGGEASIFASRPEQFDELAAAATEAAKKMRAEQTAARPFDLERELERAG